MGECEGSECGGREDVMCEGRMIVKGEWWEHVRECDGSECKGE